MNEGNSCANGAAGDRIPLGFWGILGKIMTLPGSAVVLNHLRLSSFHLSHNFLSLGSRILSIKLHERL